MHVLCWLLLAAPAATATHPCAHLLAALTLRARPVAEATWTRGGLASELHHLVRSARRPGQLVEEARIFRFATNEWTIPPHVTREEDGISKVLFNLETLIKLARHAALVHTHPVGLFLADESARILFALPSPEDVRLAARLRREAGARFLIVSPHFITEVIANDDAHADAYEAVMGGLNLAASPRQVLAQASALWSGVRVRLVHALR